MGVLHGQRVDRGRQRSLGDVLIGKLADAVRRRVQPFRSVGLRDAAFSLRQLGCEKAAGRRGVSSEEIPVWHGPGIRVWHPSRIVGETVLDHQSLATELLIERPRRALHLQLRRLAIPEDRISGGPAGALVFSAAIEETKSIAADDNVVEKDAGRPAFKRAAQPSASVPMHWKNTMGPEAANPVPKS